MKLLFRQRFFSWFDSYDIYDEDGNTVYVVKGQLSWGHCLKIFDASGLELGTVKEKILTWLPKFELYEGSSYVGCISKKLSFFKPRYDIDCCGWHVEGSFLEWDYSITGAAGEQVAVISKEIFHMTDTYVLDIVNPVNALRVLMFVLAIDAEKMLPEFKLSARQRESGVRSRSNSVRSQLMEVIFQKRMVIDGSMEIAGEYRRHKYCRLLLEKSCRSNGMESAELTQAERSGIHTFLDYCNLARTQYKSFDSVCRMAEDVKEGDLLWMRSRNEGKYYIARVKANSTWVFREDAVQIDAANQLTNIDWYPATDKADEESVPGAVATSFIMGSAIQRIKKNGVEAYSQMLYNRVHDSALDLFNYPDPVLSLCEKHFYSLLQPEDVEDLLALWLYDTKGYVCIPSTNKIATPKYECVLVDPNDLNRKHIYIQVKKGDVSLNTDDYSSLNGEVYLLTTEGNVQNAQKYTNVKAASNGYL